jgi:hypothetical protein
MPKAVDLQAVGNALETIRRTHCAHRRRSWQAIPR